MQCTMAAHHAQQLLHSGHSYYGQLKVFTEQLADRGSVFNQFRTCFQSHFHGHIHNDGSWADLNCQVQDFFMNVTPALDYTFSNDNLVIDVIRMRQNNDPIIRLFGDVALTAVALVHPQLAVNLMERQDIIMQFDGYPEVVKRILLFGTGISYQDQNQEWLFAREGRDDLQITFNPFNETTVALIAYLKDHMRGVSFDAVTDNWENVHEAVFNHSAPCTPLFWRTIKGELSSDYMQKDLGRTLVRLASGYSTQASAIAGLLPKYAMYLQYADCLPLKTIEFIIRQLEHLRAREEDLFVRLADTMFIAGSTDRYAGRVNSAMSIVSKAFPNENFTRLLMSRINTLCLKISHPVPAVYPPVSDLITVKFIEDVANTSTINGPLPFVFRVHNVAFKLKQSNRATPLSVFEEQKRLLNWFGELIGQLELPLQSAFSGNNLIYCEPAVSCHEIIITTDADLKFVFKEDTTVEDLRSMALALVAKKADFPGNHLNLI